MKGSPSLLPGKIAYNREVAPGHFLMGIDLPSGYAEPSPGQFFMLREKDAIDPLLGRPLSVHGFSRSGESALVEFLYRVAGKGTQRLSMKGIGDGLDLIGPLGTPFRGWEGKSTVILVAGGIGIAPLVYLASCIGERRNGDSPDMIAYLGASSSEVITAAEQLERFCSEIRICTDDGSRGFQCPVTELLIDDLTRYDPEDSIIYTCGPLAMIERLRKILWDTSFECQVAIEERMACGFGACLGCSIEVYGPDGQSRFERVCSEGPVFDLRAIARCHWEEGLRSEP